MIGLWFTLRTHAAVIWNEAEEKKTHEAQMSSSQQPPDMPTPGRLQRMNTLMSERPSELRDTQLYKRILGNSLREVGLAQREESRNNSAGDLPGTNGSAQTPHLVPPKSSSGDSAKSSIQIPGFSDAQSSSLVREVAEMAATAATYAARDATRAVRKKSIAESTPAHAGHRPSAMRTTTVRNEVEDLTTAEALAGAGNTGGHDAPNWSRMKSAIILCGATLLYALIAEILVNTVDEVLANISIDEKFLGITLFALVPNTTEFLVCIHFQLVNSSNISIRTLSLSL